MIQVAQGGEYFNRQMRIGRPTADECLLHDRLQTPLNDFQAFGWSFCAFRCEHSGNRVSTTWQQR
jgi:hypothetical protein